MDLLPQTCQAREIKVRVIGDDGRSTQTGQRFKSWRHDHTTCLAGSELVLVFGVAEKANLIMLGRLQRGQASDDPIGVTAQTSTKPIDQRGKRQRHWDEPVKRGYLAAEALSALITFSVMSCLGLI